jgi:hypothetical protein
MPGAYMHKMPGGMHGMGMLDMGMGDGSGMGSGAMHMEQAYRMQPQQAGSYRGSSTPNSLYDGNAPTTQGGPLCNSPTHTGWDMPQWPRPGAGT